MWFVYVLSMIVLSGCMKNDMLNVLSVSSSDMVLLLVGKNSFEIVIVKKL